MNRESETSVVALGVMALITLLNASLAIGIAGAVAVDSRFATAFDSQHIYQLAGVELPLILLAYVISRHFQLRKATCKQVAS